MRACLCNLRQVVICSRIIIKCQPSISRIQPSRLLSSSNTLLKKYAKSSDIHPDAVAAAEWHDVPTVLTTYTSVKGSKQCYYGVFWNDNDPMNVFKPLSRKDGNLFHAAIESVLLALRQAIHERKLHRVIVRTDSEYIATVAKRFLKIWRENGYTKADGTPVKHKQELQDLDNLLASIDARIEAIPPSQSNYVVEKLKENLQLNGESQTDSGIFNPHTAKPNIIYVCGAFVESDRYNTSGYGIFFKDKTALNTCGRFAKYPVTLLRSQMYGIITALELAKVEGIKDISLVCNSPVFVKFFNRQWKKYNGEPVANHLFYKQIVALAEELDVTFSYLEDSEDENFKNAELLATDGLSFPIMNEQSHDQPRESWIIVFDREHNEKLEETQEEWKEEPRVHLIITQKSAKRYLGVFNKTDNNSSTAFSPIIGNAMVATASSLIPLLENAIKEGKKRIAVRTNEKRLPLVIHHYLKKWEETQYTTVHGKPVFRQDVYKKVAALLKDIEIRIEVFENAELPSDEDALKYCNSKINVKNENVD